MKIGFLGLGIMGSRMAANLIKAGHELTVWNRTKEKAQPLLSAGARWADTPAGAAAEVVFTMLATPQAVEETALGQDGFLPAMAPGSTWVDCSTVDPLFSRRMAVEADARKVHFLDAPVFGSKAAAQDAQLVFLVGGNDQDVQAVRPLLEAMGRGINHIGPVSRGSAFKIINNILVAQAVMTFSEALALGVAMDFPPEQLFDQLAGLPVVAPYIKTKKNKILGDASEADFPLQWMRKDLELAAETAYRQGIAIPLANLSKEIFQMAVQAGLGTSDFGAIFHFIEKDE